MKSFKKNNIGKALQKSKHLLYNRYVLIFIFILTIGNIVQLASQGDYFTCAVLLLVGFLTSFFSKNMVVIMVVGMAFANILKYGTKMTNPWVAHEGFKTEEEKETEKLLEENKDEVEKTVNEEKSNKEDSADSSSKKTNKGDDEEDLDVEDGEEEEFTTKSSKKISKSEKQKLIESDALDDLRAEMKIGFKRLNQNIDSIQTMGFFN